MELVKPDTLRHNKCYVYKCLPLISFSVAISFVRIEKQTSGLMCFTRALNGAVVFKLFTRRMRRALALYAFRISCRNNVF